MKFLIVIYLFFLPSIALAATTGLSVSRFDVSAIPGQVVSESVWVENTDTIAQNYVLSVDGDGLDENISIVPNQFSLEPGQSKKVAMRLRAPEKNTRAFISLIAQDSNHPSGLSVANGIKLPVYFTITAPSALSDSGAVALFQAHGTIPWVKGLVWGFDFFLLALFVYLRRRRARLKHLPVEIQRFLNDI